MAFLTSYGIAFVLDDEVAQLEYETNLKRLRYEAAMVTIQNGTPDVTLEFILVYVFVRFYLSANRRFCIAAKIFVRQDIFVVVTAFDIHFDNAVIATWREHTIRL